MINLEVFIEDDDEAPLKRKEQQDHELSDVQPKHQRNEQFRFFWLSRIFVAFLDIFRVKHNLSVMIAI